MFSLEFIFFLNWLTIISVSVCMCISSAGELVPLYLEIEANFRRNNAERKKKLLHDKTVASNLEATYFYESSSSNSPTSRESPIVEFEAKVMCRNLPFGGRATRDSRVRLPREEGARSHYQCLFEENVRKTRTCCLRTLIVKGLRVVFTHGKGISTLRVRHKGR